MKIISPELKHALRLVADQLVDIKQIDIDELHKTHNVDHDLSFNIPEYVATVLYGYLIESQEIQGRIFESGLKITEVE